MIRFCSKPASGMTRSFITVVWSSLATAFIVTLLAGMFLLALPKVYRATATVAGTGDAVLYIRSEAFLSGVVSESNLPINELETFQDVLLRRKGPDDRVARLIENMTVEKDPFESWIDISIDAPDAELAADVANAVARRYVLSRAEDEDSSELERQASQNVTDAIAELEAFNSEHGGRAALEAAHAEQLRQQAALDVERQHLEQQLEARRVHVGQVQDGDFESLMDDQSFAMVLSQRNQKQLNYDQLQTRYGKQHQKMVAAEAELATAETMLRTQAMVSSKRLTQEIKRIQTQQRDLELRVSSLEEMKAGSANRLKTLNDLEQAVQEAKTEFDSVTQQLSAESYAKAIVPRDLISTQLLWMLAGVFGVTTVLVSVILVFRSSLGQPA